MASPLVGAIQLMIGATPNLKQLVKDAEDTGEEANINSDTINDESNKEENKTQEKEVFINLEGNNQSGGFNLLNKRCHIINCEIDKKGRVSLNLNLIKKFLGCKPRKYDFTKVYFK